MANTEKEKTGQELHIEVERLRESGKFWESIKLAQDAVKAYLEEKNYGGLADVHGSISLAYRHLYRTLEDKTFLVLAEGAATIGIEIAKYNNINDRLARPVFNLAKVQEDLGQLGEASVTYQEAVDIFKKYPQKEHNRAGVLADMEIHLYTCEVRAGKKESLPKALTAIESLIQSDERTVSEYNYIVWLSGGHMRVAEALGGDDKELTDKHLTEARKLISDNIQKYPDLNIRKEQLDELAKTI